MGSEWGSVSTWSIEAEEWSSISRNDEEGTVLISWTVVASGIANDWYSFSGWLTDCFSGAITTGCSFTGVFTPITYEITYLWTGEDYVPSATGYTIKSDDVTLENPSKTWYTFTWRSGTNIQWVTWTVTISSWSTWDRVYEANWEATEYTITYELDNWVNSPNNVTWYTIEDTITFENPTKDWYTFDGWFTDAQFTTWITTIPTWTTWPITVYAKWTEIKKPSWGYSGGGGRSNSVISSDSEKSTEWETWSTVDSSTSSQNDQNTENVIQSETKWSEESSNTPMDSSAEASWWQYSEEFQEAYEFAKENGITTMDSIEKANMNWPLTRIAMAKMLSYYAINVLWQTPDETRINKFNDITDKLDADYDNGVTLAYQLWIMWINMPNNNFRPNDLVTRAEFATALSRMLYSTPDGNPYYVPHIQKLKTEWIITNDDYKMKELRWYVMIMLMRSAQ